MARKPDIQYVQQFYVHGSEAKVLELKPRRRVIKTILPKVAPDKRIRIGVDPLALGGIVVAIAMLIMMVVGCGQYETVQAASDALVEVASTVYPDGELTEKYEARYQQFRKIYPACKALFAELV